MKKLHDLTHEDMNTTRFRRARRFADTVLWIMRDFVPNDRIVHRRIVEYLTELGYETNAEFINVPPELDELNKLELERRMIETHPVFVRGNTTLV